MTKGDIDDQVARIGLTRNLFATIIYQNFICGEGHTDNEDMVLNQCLELKLKEECLESSLYKFFQKRLGNLKCKECGNKKVDGKKIFKVQSFPQFLVISIDRFDE